MSDLATLAEVQNLWKPLTEDEQAKVNTLLPIVSDLLRQEAANVGKDIDEMINCGQLRRNVVVSVVADIVRRYMNTLTDESAPKTQFSESALGYSVSGTYLVPGGGMFIKKNELARLGLRRQKIGRLDFAGYNCNPPNA